MAATFATASISTIEPSGFDNVSIKINFVYSRDLSKNIPIIQNYANQVQGLLNRYSDLASGKIELNFIEPEPYSDDEDYDTLGGFVLSQVGKLPEKGDEFEYEHVSIKVQSIKDRRILSLEVKRLNA